MELSHPSPGVFETTVGTSLGRFRIVERDNAIVRLRWGSGRADDTPLLREAAGQIHAYAEKRLRQFDLPLAPTGPSFQRAVWAELLKIPYGETRSYGDLAHNLQAIARAVGGACGANPIPLLIPCHRVIAQTGELGGFSGGQGVVTKRALLLHEGALAEQFSLF